MGEIEDQINEILALVFKNYKSLDESVPSGIMDVVKPATGLAALVLEPAVKLFTLLQDILSPEAQNKLYSYFQVCQTDTLYKMQCKIHLLILLIRAYPTQLQTSKMKTQF